MLGNVSRQNEGAAMAESSGETGQVTGTKDKDYNLIWFTEQSLSNALRLEEYIQDAERDGDSELAEFFRRAQNASRKGGEQGKEMLRKRFAS
jgi:LPS O-antigen subunit length determinant protein (WzzB/FepE family)